MALSYWRPRAVAVIRKVLAAHPDATREEQLRFLSNAYPFGPKENFPHRVWREEVRYALGLETRARRKSRAVHRDPIPREQSALF